LYFILYFYFIQKSWDLFKDLAHLRSHKIQKAESYDFNEIVREENADQLVFIPHNRNDDKLWYERIRMEEKSFNAYFEVYIFLFIHYFQFFFLYLYFIFNFFSYIYILFFYFYLYIRVYVVIISQHGPLTPLSTTHSSFINHYIYLCLHSYFFAFSFSLSLYYYYLLIYTTSHNKQLVTRNNSFFIYPQHLFADESVQKVTLDKNFTKKVFLQKRQEGVYWLSEVDQCQVIKPICDLMTARDPKLVKVLLDGLSNILLFAEKVGQLENARVYIEEIDGLNKIKKLQEIENEEVNKLAYSMVENFFSDEVKDFDIICLTANLYDFFQ
jgi:hypothetical protein